MQRFILALAEILNQHFSGTSSRCQPNCPGCQVAFPAPERSFAIAVTSAFICSDASCGAVRIYDGRGNTTDAKTLLRTCNAHSHPVTAMKYACFIVLSAQHICNTIRMFTSAPHNAVISTDAAGMLEIWDPTTLALPQSVTFKFKSDTGLYDLAKSKTLGKSIEVPPDVASPSS
jgi:hypothetical protein